MTKKRTAKKVLTAKELYWQNKGKKVKDVAYCPVCKQEFQISNIVRVVVCNRCGYHRPAEKRES